MTAYADRPLSTPTLRRDVLAFVKERRWRGEERIIREFTRLRPVGGGAWVARASRGMIEDTLFDLVLREEIIWFGADNRGDRPMRYRALKRPG